MTMIESTNLEISNTQNEAVHPIRSGVLNALISGLKLILIPTDCSDHSRLGWFRNQHEPGRRGNAGLE